MSHSSFTYWHLFIVWLIFWHGLPSYAGQARATTSTVPTTGYTLQVQKAGSGQGSVASTATSTVKSASVSTRIVGGQSVSPGDWPWQVRLKITVDAEAFLCGGVLLSTRWVVTAAHCITDSSNATLSPEAVNVRLGSIWKDSGGVVANVDRIIRHSAHDANTNDNDIALLRLASPVGLSSTINTIAPLLATQESTLAPTNTLATVTGWGNTSYGGSPSTVLMQVQVPLLTTSDCRQLSAYPAADITDNMICAGNLAGGQDSCNGDSGGPVVVPNGRGGYVLAGLVSWGESCALPNYPGVYTRVAKYQSWLQTQTGLVFTAPPAIECGTVCSTPAAAQSSITLQATAATGSTFSGWSGACTGTSSTCTITMTANKSVTATFERNISPPLPLASDFVAQQYRDFLGRTADALEINYWTNQLNTGAISRPAMIYEYMNSVEFNSQYAPLVRLYGASFNRLPDYSGLYYWHQQMYSNSIATGPTLLEVAHTFANSPEFIARYGNLSDDDFIVLLYKNVLQRAPDAIGFSFWLNELKQGRTRGAVLLDFSDSIEYQKTSQVSLFITMAYIGMLQRTPDDSSYTDWLEKIQSGQRSALELIDTILQSTEYAKRFF